MVDSGLTLSKKPPRDIFGMSIVLFTSQLCWDYIKVLCYVQLCVAPLLRVLVRPLQTALLGPIVSLLGPLVRLPLVRLPRGVLREKERDVALPNHHLSIAAPNP